MIKPITRIGENKNADQCALTAQLSSAFISAIEIKRIYDGVEISGKFLDYSSLIRGSAEDETRII